MRRGSLILLAAFAGLAAALPGRADAALTATDIRIGNHPAFVRIVVDFGGGRLRSPDVEATDPFPFPDGRALVEVSKPGIDNDAAAEEAFGVRARIVQEANRLVLRLRADRHRFKYLAYDILRSPQRLVLDLWKARPPPPAAEFESAPQGGCLTIDDRTVGRGTAHAEGTEEGVFENMFALVLRGAGGRGVTSVGVTSTPAGNWSRTVSYTVGSRQPGTLEVVDFSAKDGSLVCIAQVRVTLRPPPR
jgi:hypothetical protein